MKKKIISFIVSIISVTGVLTVITFIIKYFAPTEEEIKKRKEEKRKNNIGQPEGEKCSKCKWWIDVGDMRAKMVCKKNPPTQAHYNNCNHNHHNLHISNATVVEWPETKASDWCGEFKNKIKKNNK